MTLPLAKFEPYLYFENGKMRLSNDAPRELVEEFEKMLAELDSYSKSEKGV